MARSFAITTTATEALRADAKGHAEAGFTATNTTSRAIRGLAKATPLGDTKQGWLNIQGEAERDFAPGGTQQFTVSFNGPGPESASATPAGGTAPTAGAATPAARRYPFRLDVASALNPDEDYTEGPTATVEITPTPLPAPRPFPWWIIPVAAVVLIGIGFTLWLLLRTKNVDVPDVVGKPVAEATSILEKQNLKATVKETKVTGEVSAGSVVSQDPAAGGERVPEGNTVELVVEGEAPRPTGPIINFADSAASAKWTNDLNAVITLTATHDDLPQGSVVNRDNQLLENNAAAVKVIETHPRWGAPGGNITGTYTLPEPLSGGSRFRTAVGFLQGAKPGSPSVRLRVLFNGTVIDEISKSYDGSLRDWTVNLSDHAGESGQFSLQVLGLPTSHWAWICWINPRIER